MTNGSAVKTLLCLGHGYTAQALSGMLTTAGGWHVVGTARSRDRFGRIIETGAEPRSWPGDDISSDVAAADCILVSIAPDQDGDPVLRALSDQVASSASRVQWVGYLSTTAVYGDRQGGWVDEGSELTPSTERGRWRVAAEEAWQRLSRRTGLKLHIFRLAGIYGPGRGPLHQLLSGRKSRIVRSSQKFNRIHVIDIARILHASMLRPAPGSIYNVCDDCPATTEEVMEYAARRAGVDLPDKVDIENAMLSEMARSFYSESKMVRSKHVKAHLSVRLRYPNFKSGIDALLSDPEKSE